MASPRHWAGTRTLVTGATGFIGSQLTRRLTTLGADVHAVSRKPVAPATAGGTSWHVADLADAQTTAELIRAVAPEVVFHLASAVTGARDVTVVRPVMDANLTSVVNLLSSIAVAPIRIRLVLAGSVEETSGPGNTPASPYAAAKSAATGYARMFHRLWDVAVSVLRVSMVYGPGQPDTAKLIPYATLELLAGRNPELSSGTRLIDWVYVEDVVDAFLAAGESDKSVGHVLDIGSGTQVSIRDTVELLAEIVGGTGGPRFGAISDRPMDHAQVADPAPAAQLLDWHPSTALADGLRRTVDWYASL